VSIRRSASMVRHAGEGAEVVEGATKSGQPRLIDLDAATVAVVKAHRAAHIVAVQVAPQVIGDCHGPPAVVGGLPPTARHSADAPQIYGATDTAACGQGPAVRTER
jgi:hypothetical protein